MNRAIEEENELLSKILDFVMVRGRRKTIENLGI